MTTRHDNHDDKPRRRHACHFVGGLVYGLVCSPVGSDLDLRYVKCIPRAGEREPLLGPEVREIFLGNILSVDPCVRGKVDEVLV